MGHVMMPRDDITDWCDGSERHGCRGKTHDSVTLFCTWSKRRARYNVSVYNVCWGWFYEDNVCQKFDLSSAHFCSVQTWTTHLWTPAWETLKCETYVLNSCIYFQFCFKRHLHDAWPLFHWTAVATILLLYKIGCNNCFTDAENTILVERDRI